MFSRWTNIQFYFDSLEIRIKWYTIILIVSIMFDFIASTILKYIFFLLYCETVYDIGLVIRKQQCKES